MHRSLAIISSLSVIVAAVCAMGCSSKTNNTGDDSSEGGTTCDPTMPVSFKTDVIPAFQQNCTLTGSCHGQKNNSAEENLFLGFEVGMGTTDPMDVYSQLVGVPSQEDPSMNLVTAGDLSNSYLWQKLNTDLMPPPPALAAGCMKATKMCTDCSASLPCGNFMPYDGTPLATSDPPNLCITQRWITQGAQNN